MMPIPPAPVHKEGMATIQELTFIRKGRLEWREVPRPALRGPLEALVRPIVASRCDGDALFLFREASRWLALGAALHLVDPEVRAMGDPPFAGPFPYGHECIGEVVEVGEAVTTVVVGQQVIVPWAISCGACSICSRGLTSHCERKQTSVAAYGFGTRTGGWGGAVSDLLRVPYADAMLVPVPAGMSPLDLASASDNIPDAWRTVGPHLRQQPGAPVLVVGGSARSIGLYAAGIAVAMGSGHVDYVDANQDRLALAAAMGARPIQVTRQGRWFSRGASPHPGGYAITVDASNRQAGLEFALRSLAPGGVCTSVGFYFRSGTPLPLWRMFLKGTRLHIGLSNPRADLPEVLALIAQGRFQPARVSTTIAVWEEAPQALLDRRATKVVVARRELLPSASDPGRYAGNSPPISS
jgi:threonine dehydrogenase-like Zn-dependent dehydrogenase